MCTNRKFSFLYTNIFILCIIIIFFFSMYTINFFFSLVAQAQGLWGLPPTDPINKFDKELIF